MLITTRKLVKEFNIPLKRNTKFQNLLRFPLLYLIFLTITCAHAYLTDSATFGAIEQHEVWIFLHLPSNSQTLQRWLLFTQADRKKVK